MGALEIQQKVRTIWDQMVCEEMIPDKIGTKKEDSKGTYLT